MFPLGTVLFPSMYLPLHVFEPRYREMTRACLAGSREFGVVLIERGSEVGGRDVRTEVGTVASIVEAAEMPDGRWALATVGTRRIKVRSWLDDDPYPRADVDDWPDPDDPAALAADHAEVVATLRRVLALKAELAEAAPAATIELAADPILGSYQAAAVAPFGPADQHALLSCVDARSRLERLRALLDEEETFLRARIAGG